MHLKHGEKVIQWDRTTGWVQENLLNQFSVLEQEDGYCVEHTGLHEREFIETKRVHTAEGASFAGVGSVANV